MPIDLDLTVILIFPFGVGAEEPAASGNPKNELNHQCRFGHISGTVSSGGLVLGRRRSVLWNQMPPNTVNGHPNTVDSNGNTK